MSAFFINMIVTFFIIVGAIPLYILNFLAYLVGKARKPWIETRGTSTASGIAFILGSAITTIAASYYLVSLGF